MFVYFGLQESDHAAYGDVIYYLIWLSKYTNITGCYMAD